MTETKAHRPNQLTWSERPKSPFFAALFASLLIVFFFWSKPPLTLAFDPNDEKCLPGFHLALLVHLHPDRIHEGDYVFWKPAGALHYVVQEYVLKQVAGVSGDHLQIKAQDILINGRRVATGLALGSLYQRTPAQLARDEVIPRGAVFVIGTHPHSDDSRYWGYLDEKDILGVGYPLY